MGWGGLRSKQANVTTRTGPNDRPLPASRTTSHLTIPSAPTRTISGKFEITLQPAQYMANLKFQKSLSVASNNCCKSLYVMPSHQVFKAVIIVAAFR